MQWMLVLSVDNAQAQDVVSNVVGSTIREPFNTFLNHRHYLFRENRYVRVECRGTRDKLHS